MDRLLALREADAKAKSAFYAGLTDKHPHGLSGHKFLLPYENDRRCNDGGEYGRESEGV